MLLVCWCGVGVLLMCCPYVGVLLVCCQYVGVLSVCWCVVSVLVCCRCVIAACYWCLGSFTTATTRCGTFWGHLQVPQCVVAIIQHPERVVAEHVCHNLFCAFLGTQNAQ